MTYIVLNKTNVFEPSYNTEYATFDEAERVAKEYLVKSPSSKLVVVSVEKVYTAEVVITTKDPQPVETQPEEVEASE